MSIEIRAPNFVPECFFLVREKFSKKVVWDSFGITKSLTAGNLKILFKNRRQKNQKLPKIDAATLKSVSENPKFVIFNFSHIFFKIY